MHEEELEEGEEETGPRSPPSPSAGGEGSSQLPTPATPATPATSIHRPPPTTTSAGGRAATPQRGLAGKRKRGDDDPVGAALLGRLEELRQEAIQKRGLHGTFTSYLQSFLEELPQDDAKRLVKDIQKLMLSY